MDRFYKKRKNKLKKILMENIKDIINFINLKKKIKIIFFDKNKFKKNDYKDTKNTLIIFKFRKVKIFELLKYLFFLIKNNKAKLNLLIFYNFKNDLIIQNLLPSLRMYRYNNFFENIIFWIKQLLYLLLKFKKINYVAIKLK